MIAMDVSTENAIGYICIALVLIAWGVCLTYLIAKGHVHPNWEWLGQSEKSCGCDGEHTC